MRVVKLSGMNKGVFMTMRTRTYFYFLRQALISLTRNGLMSLASIGTMVVSLVILGMFLMMIASLGNIVTSLESKVEVTAFLKDSVSDEEMVELKETIGKLEGVKEIVFVSKAEAFQELKEKMGNKSKVLTAVESNPLPDSFEIKAKNPAQVSVIAKELIGFKQIEEVKYGQEVVEKLFTLTKVLRWVGVTLIVLMTLATIYIIVNTIRLTVFARRKEIKIMKLVGATDWFIRWPFLIEGILLGLVGAAIAVLLLRESYTLIIHRAQDALPFIPIGGNETQVANLSYWLLLIGALIGAIGSTISLHRFLQV